MRVAILGCGVMGSAFARKFHEAGHSLIIYDSNLEKLGALAAELDIDVAKNAKEAAHSSDFVLLAIKPKDLKAVAHAIGRLEGQVICSILAGVSLGELKRTFPGCEVVRSMPNLAISEGEGVIALAQDPELPHWVIEKVEHLMEGLGLVLWTEEAKTDAITALCGSGPAFVLSVLEAMVESGIMMGLAADEAQKLAIQTMQGALSMLKERKEHPAELRWKICSPGGTTIAGILALEESGVRPGMMNTILAAFEKTKEMH